MATVTAIEIGYGTLTYPVRENERRAYKTFPSTVCPAANGDLSGGFSKRNTVIVNVDGKAYEVGPEAELLSDRTSTRTLNSKYIDTDQYKALFLGALASMNETNIDLLVLSLPVNNMHRSADLRKFATGKHEAGDKTVYVNSVWVLCQPLAGFMHYATTIGPEEYSKIAQQNCLVIDFGYLTVDWLVTKGLKINERKSDARNLGMSVILESCESLLRGAPGLEDIDDISQTQIDRAFYADKGVLNIGSKALPFPTCKNEDVDGNAVNIEFDCSKAISHVTTTAMQAVRHSAGAGADIRTIIVMGGSHSVYMEAVREAYPSHNIVVVPDPLIAVCKGMVEGGKQYYEATKLKGAS